MAKRSTAKRSTEYGPLEGDRELMDRMQAVEKQLALLVDALLKPDVPKEIKAKGLKRRTAPVPTAETARRARVGRAAKRYGMTYQEWVQRYGMVEKLPGSERQETLPGVVRRKPRSK
jgi:hypothetical protein